jgi:Rod binding domain-containing protein
MDVSPIQRHVEAAAVPPERLAGNPQLTPQQKISEVARQFEALLLRQILQNTQKTVIPSTFSDDSTAASIYHDLVTEQLAESISKSGTLGLAKMLNQQLTCQLRPASKAGHDCAPEAPPTSPGGTGVARPSSCGASHLSQVLNLQPPTRGSTASTSHE